MHTVFRDIRRELTDRLQEYRQKAKDEAAERAATTAFKLSITKDRVKNRTKRKKKFAVHRVRMFRHRTQQRYRNWRANNKEVVMYVRELGQYVFLYGTLINYSLHVLVNLWFDMNLPLFDVQTLVTIPAYGIAYYFLKPELVEILQDIRR